MRVFLRPARLQDFGYCAQLYFAEMERTRRALNIDMAAHTASFRQRWEPAEVRIVTLDGEDVGWLQTTAQDDALFVAQLFVEPRFQRHGIGTEVMKHVIAEAAGAG